MLIQTTRFGEVEIQDSDILTFPSGLLGFSNEHHYVLIEDEMGSPFQWLQSLDNQELAFVTISPEIAFNDFSLDLTEDHLKKLEAKDIKDLTVKCIVTMAKQLKDVTVNLQGPLLLNLKKKLCMQVVVADGTYTTRHPLFGDKLEIASKEKVDQAEKQPVAQAG